MFSVHYSSMESVARANLQKTMDGFSQTITRLSTGKRINSPKDDPSGFVAVQLIRSDMARARGDIKANQSRGSVLSVVDSGLGNIISLLNEAKGLIVAGANTGALTKDQIDAYQAQLDATLESIQRITNSTSFQGIKVLEGLSGLLNGTMSEEQRDQYLGISKNSTSSLLYKESISSNKQVELSATGNNLKGDEIMLGDFADDLLSTLKTVSKIQDKVAGEDTKDVALNEDLAQYIQEYQIEQTEADIFTAVDSWVLDRFGADADETVRQTLITNLFEQTLNSITSDLAENNDSKNGESGENADKTAILSLSSDELLELVCVNLESMFSEGEEISLEQAVEKLNSVKREAEELAEQKRIEEEEIAKALAEKEQLAAEKAEKERKKKEEAEKLAALKEHADKMYFLTRKDSSSQVELVQDKVEKKTLREERMEQIQNIFSGEKAQQKLADDEKSQQFSIFTKIASQLKNDPDASEEKNKVLFQAIRDAMMEKAIAKSAEKAKETDEQSAKKAEDEINAFSIDLDDSVPVLKLDAESIAAQSETGVKAILNGVDASESSTNSINLTATTVELTLEEPQVDVEVKEEVVAKSIEDLKTGGIADLHTNPEAADKYIDALIKSFSLARVKNGIDHRSLEVDNEMLTNEMFHLQQLESQISDADFAEEASKLARYKILMMTGTKALQVAQDVTKLAFSFLDNATSSSLLIPGKNEK